MKVPVTELLDLPHVWAFHTMRLMKKSIRGVSTDSRQVSKGDLFIALRGENFDGHAFIPAAIKAGAMLAIADRQWAETFPNADAYPAIIVDDTVKTMGALALAYRRKFSIPVIAVAGSNGKTTTKEMIAAVLSRKYNVLSTAGNLNNHIGVPHTLFRLTPRHQIAVVEIGTNHPGEIRYLCDILAPTHGILSNIGREHLEFFGDLDGVATEEGTLFRRLRNDGTIFVNADDVRVRAAARGAKRRIVYGLSVRGVVDVRGTVVGVDERGSGTFTVTADGKRPFRINMGVPGLHAMANALAAAAVGIAFKVPTREIDSALTGFRAVSKRMEVGRVDGVTILNDTYNANPDSVLSALQTLQAMKTTGKKIVVLGDMRELGDRSEEEHRGIGAAAAQMKFDYLLTYGPAARWIHDEARGIRYRVHYDNQRALEKDLENIIGHGDAVLIKGSRGMKMENIVGTIERHARGLGNTAPRPVKAG